MPFDPPSRAALTAQARRHLPDADFVEVLEMFNEKHPYKLVVRKGTGFPWVQHFAPSELFLACKLAATHFEIGVKP